MSSKKERNHSATKEFNLSTSQAEYPFEKFKENNPFVQVYNTDGEEEHHQKDNRSCEFLSHPRNLPFVFTGTKSMSNWSTSQPKEVFTPSTVSASSRTSSMQSSNTFREYNVKSQYSASQEVFSDFAGIQTDSPSQPISFFNGSQKQIRAVNPNVALPVSCTDNAPYTSHITHGSPSVPQDNSICDNPFSLSSVVAPAHPFTPHFSYNHSRASFNSINPPEGSSPTSTQANRVNQNSSSATDGLTSLFSSLQVSSPASRNPLAPANSENPATSKTLAASLQSAFYSTPPQPPPPPHPPPPTVGGYLPPPPSPTTLSPSTPTSPHWSTRSSTTP